MGMNIRTRAGVRFLLALALLVPSAGGAEVIRLRPGFQRILELPGASRISVGNPEIIEARPLARKDGILVVGKKEGETDLVIWEGDKRTVHGVVVREKRQTPAEEARALTAPFADVTVAESGDLVVVSGSVPSAGDKTMLESFAAAHPGVVLRLTLPGDEKTLLSYDLKIIEISRGASSQLGIRWPDSLGAKVAWAAGGQAGPLFTVTGDFEMRLNLLLADGRARILANPRLVCETNESASFLAGGEIPIVIVTPETRTVEWKTYGIILRLRPRMAHGNLVSTEITAEISTVDHAGGTADVPAFLTRRMTTFFSTPPGRTVMLSGLVKSEAARDVARVPVLGQIPVLGELFRSRSFRENESELAVFITPTAVRADAGAELAEWAERADRERKAMGFRRID